ncbi:MAG: thioredoxin family protein [Bacilli bacterium]|nr:thioredoxin family protein [Bacilli bacterium]
MKCIRIGAVWCPACLIMRNRWKKLDSSLKDIEIVEYDLDMDEDKITYEVGNILPVCIFEKEGVEIERIIGEKTEKELQEVLKKVGVKI